MMKVRNLGRKSLEEVTTKLASLGCLCAPKMNKQKPGVG